MQLRDLVAQDAAAIKALRIAVLRSDPDTFSISLEEELASSIEGLSALLAQSGRAHSMCMLGAFWPDLVGMIGFEQLATSSGPGRGRIFGLYVLQEHRRKGVASALLDEVLALARSRAGLSSLALEVSSSSRAAIALYQGAGFRIDQSVAHATSGRTDFHMMLAL